MTRRHMTDTDTFWLWMLVGLLLIALGTACAPSVRSQAAKLPILTVYTPTQGDEMGPAFKRLAEVLQRGNYTVEVVPGEQILKLNRGEMAYGLHQRWMRLIILNGDEPINTQFETLAHEAGHIFHSPQLGMDSYGAAEVFAESVGNRVQRFYGSKTALRTSSEYLAGFKHALAFLPFLERDMDYAVEVLTGKRAWPVTEEK